VLGVRGQPFSQEIIAMIRLSVVMPSNRDDLRALSRITQACSWAGPHTEVIIRDNSGSASKRRLLAQIEKENCQIIAADACGAHENGWKALERARGDFVFLISDDDVCFDRAMAELPGKIAEVTDDPSVIGITGAVMIDSSKGSNFVAYRDIGAADPLMRLAGWAGSTPCNVILFSPIRRDILKWTAEVLQSKPFRLSFDDQICSMLYLVCGKFAYLDRLLYAYDQHNWESRESAQGEDMKCYTAAGLDPAVNKLHWLLCAFEGSALVRNLPLAPSYTLSQRQTFADYWFALMFRRFQLDYREGYGSPYAGHADTLCSKWKAAAGQLTFEAILGDICQFLALTSRAHATRYFDYWSGLIGQRHAPAA
jgi:hypothetical protein